MHDSVQNLGILASAWEDRGAGMKWRVTIELSGADGDVMANSTYGLRRGGLMLNHR
jgi:hypothetical protein